MVIVITGPIASGKSTLAREIARRLLDSATRVAVIDLDVVHDMVATGGGPDADRWPLARRAAASLANAFLADGVTVVLAEGSFNRPGDRATFGEALNDGVEPVYVTLSVSFDEALRRAQADPTRGRSRDPAFLRSHFDARGEATKLSGVGDRDLVLDTERLDVEAAAAAVLTAVDRAASSDARLPSRDGAR